MGRHSASSGVSRPQPGINRGAAWCAAGPLGKKPRARLSKEVQLAREIGHFLACDTDISRIDFYLGVSDERIHITGSKLHSVGYWLANAELNLKIADADLEKADYGAAFNRGDKQFLFRSVVMFSDDDREDMPDWMGRMIADSLFRDDALTKGLVLHEAVHALLESEGRALLRLSDEAAAYLAQVLFHVYCDTYDFLMENAGEGKKIYETARKIIDKHKLDKKPGTHVKFSEYRPLSKVIQAMPNYDHIGSLERYKLRG